MGKMSSRKRMRKRDTVRQEWIKILKRHWHRSGIRYNKGNNRYRMKCRAIDLKGLI